MNHKVREQTTSCEELLLSPLLRREVTHSGPTKNTVRTGAMKVSERGRRKGESRREGERENTRDRKWHGGGMGQSNSERDREHV